MKNSAAVILFLVAVGCRREQATPADVITREPRAASDTVVSTASTDDKATSPSESELRSIRESDVFHQPIEGLIPHEYRDDQYVEAQWPVAKAARRAGLVTAEYDPAKGMKIVSLTDAGRALSGLRETSEGWIVPVARRVLVGNPILEMDRNMTRQFRLRWKYELEPAGKGMRFAFGNRNGTATFENGWLQRVNLDQQTPDFTKPIAGGTLDW